MTDRVRRVVIILAKAPVPGGVKTRLVPPATPDGAAEVAAAALLDTLDAARAVPDAAVLVALAGDARDGVRAAELTAALAGTTVVPQGEGTLGERIAAAHEEAARRFPDAVSLQIGMDTPQVDAALLAAAFEVVDEVDTVDGVDAVDAAGEPVLGALGPAVDGGWWALALRHPRTAAVVTPVPTSRDDTGERTLAALRAGLPGEVRELPTLADVDTAADAAVVAELVPDGRFARAVGELLGVGPVEPVGPVGERQAR
ncbi:DUF2064 domain-containing protein [Actinomycetospora straminea]|uniref:DUF2064 domain-containing protein n=1 Tax=Actinomycetospora straminea TaxID=663607 RepID=A0ABP9FAN0_9PSEU|nr:DUF2064 domain-containing protein [Actinomycetospora straminea]